MRSPIHFYTAEYLPCIINNYCNKHSLKNIEWFHSYLSSRYQKTVIDQASSTSRKVSVGAPQGSILGPLLFAIYINDLPKVLRNTTVTLFADDSALYCSSQSARGYRPC